MHVALAHVDEEHYAVTILAVTVAVVVVKIVGIIDNTPCRRANSPSQRQCRTVSHPTGGQAESEARQPRRCQEALRGQQAGEAVFRPEFLGPLTANDSGTTATRSADRIVIILFIFIPSLLTTGVQAGTQETFPRQILPSRCRTISSTRPSQPEGRRQSAPSDRSSRNNTSCPSMSC